MKLRVFDNSLRVRLSQSEVSRLAETGRITERISFIGGQNLEYTVQTGSALSASFDGVRIAVTLPAAEAAQWSSNHQVAVEGTAGPLKISIEKDFQCLHGPDSVNPDAFPNPASGS